jgi:dihydrofolate reductase
MARLIYSELCSLDLYINDKSGRFGWAMPTEEVHAFVNAREAALGTFLYGRRLYETMIPWQTVDLSNQPAFMTDYQAIWRAADKIVFSQSLGAPTTPRTRLERHFDPAAIRDLKASADRDISIGGATLAASAIRAGLVDDIHLYLNPVIVGGGTPVLPDDVHLDLELVDDHRFANGAVHLHYRVTPRA